MTSPSASPGRSVPQLPPHLLDLEPFSSTSSARFHSLYSDFSRQRSSNPTSFQANVQWWRKGLQSLVLSSRQSSAPDNNRFILRADRSLVERLKIDKLGKPLSLGPAISELVQSGFLIPESTYMNSPKSIYNSGSIGYRLASILIGKPLWWALEQTGVVGEDSYLSSLRGVVTSSSSDQDWYGEYVVVPLLEDAANKVLLIQSESSNDGLYDYDSFRRVFSDALTKMREPEARLLVKFLQRDRGVVVSDGTAIKFLNTTSTPDEKSISAIDHGILELRTAVFNLHKQVDDIQDRCETLTRKAKDALARTQKTVALSNLRMKKQLESELGKRLGALENLETTLLRVESARGDTEIMRIYQSSTATLKNILSHPLLQTDTIQDTMDALADANGDAKQINEAIHDGGHLATGVDQIDDDEIAKELEALVRGEQRHQLPDLPNAPTTPVQETKPEEMKQPTLILETS